MMQGNYFILSPDAQPFLHCWSLSVEEQFYMLFPAAFLLLYLHVKRHRTHFLAALCALSLLSCIILTYTRPAWAFFLPSRAWELLTGGILATLKKDTFPTRSKVITSVPIIGLALTILSFFVISESPAFPGYLATLPVIGTTCFLIPYDTSRSLAERLLLGAAGFYWTHVLLALSLALARILVGGLQVLFGFASLSNGAEDHYERVCRGSMLFLHREAKPYVPKSSGQAAFSLHFSRLFSRHFGAARRFREESQLCQC